MVLGILGVLALPAPQKWSVKHLNVDKGAIILHSSRSSGRVSLCFGGVGFQCPKDFGSNNLQLRFIGFRGAISA